MILSIILTIFKGFLDLVIGVLPAGTALPTAFATGFQWLFGFLYNFDFLLSVETVVTLLGLAFFFEAAILLFHLGAYVLALVRGK